MRFFIYPFPSDIQITTSILTSKDTESGGENNPGTHWAKSNKGVPIIRPKRQEEVKIIPSEKGKKKNEADSANKVN